MKKAVHEHALDCLLESDLDAKKLCVENLQKAWQEGDLSRVPPTEILAIEQPGRPDKPRLVPPRDVPRRRLGSREGQAAMLHAIAHIEFNAINLALDAVYRFPDMPEGFYTDWITVAAEEVYHFGLVRQRLCDLGYDYGDFPAHNGLWELALKTSHDLLVRMVPWCRV